MKRKKAFKLICILFFLSPLHLFAQQQPDITGLWKGELYDDTTKQYIYYELAISDDNGKLSGYSYSEFNGDNGKEIGLKTIKIKRKDNKIIIEDVELIANTYTIAPAKKVEKILVLSLTTQDSILAMSGKWITNRTRDYHQVTGTVEVKRKNDNWKEEPLTKKLEEMKLSDKLSFNQPEKKEQTITVVEPSQKAPPPPVEEKKPEQVVVEKPAKKTKKQEAIAAVAKKDSIATTIAATPTKIKPQQPVVVVPPPAAEAAIRKTQTIRTIDFVSDSLLFTLYDNGIVDGDTVSILMNKDLIFSKAGISDKPITKMIYTTGQPDSVLLTLYAENLGSIPPNTGLLIIMDGKIRYEIFFSADLQTNAAVLLRRKKKV